MKDIIYMNITKEYAKFSKCQFAHVGAILVNGRGRIISTGVNGTKPGSSNCCDHEFKEREDHKDYSDKYETHAEMNVILELIRNNVNVDGTEHTLYVTLSPCWNCLKHIAALTPQLNITRIVYADKYHRLTDLDIQEMKRYCKEQNISLDHLDCY